MHSILIAASVLTPVILGLFAVLLYVLKPKTPIGWLLLLALLELPLQPEALYYVRRPLNAWLLATLGQTSLYEFITLWYAPVTEELAKLFPVVVFALLGKISKEHLRDWFLPIGFGFGLGEAWMIAALTAADRLYPNLHWYEFGGYFGERLQVCFCHGAMCGVGLLISVGKGRWVLGTLTAFSLHFLLNCPLYYIPKLGFAPATVAFQVAITIWMMLFFLGSLVVLFSGEGAVKIGVKLFGQAKCPNCQVVFNRSLFGFNLGSFRYEKCPHCKTWNKTKRYVAPKEAA